MTIECVFENWRAIAGHPGYEVSDLGRVRSLDRFVKHAATPERAGYVGRRKGRILRPGRKPSGHLSVAIGKGNSQDVHVLVATAFLGPCPAGMEVLHLDHDPAHNMTGNLRYGTRSENLKMDYARGIGRRFGRVLNGY